MKNSLLYELVMKYCKEELYGGSLYSINLALLGFLHSREAPLNAKGERPPKRFFYGKNEVARVTFKKIFGDYKHEGKTYNNIFLGTQKVVAYYDARGGIAGSKTRKPYYFDLTPIYKEEGSIEIVGFGSFKMTEILKKERFNADNYLLSKNPKMYSFLYGYYKGPYEHYVNTGDKTPFVNALNTESRTEVLVKLNDEVNGLNITVKQLILNLLQ